MLVFATDLNMYVQDFLSIFHPFTEIIADGFFAENRQEMGLVLLRSILVRKEVSQWERILTGLKAIIEERKETTGLTQKKVAEMMGKTSVRRFVSSQDPSMGQRPRCNHRTDGYRNCRETLNFPKPASGRTHSIQSGH